MSTVEVASALRAAADDIGRALLGAAEDQWFERKSFKITAQRLAEAEVAFANAEGGTLVVGLRNGEVEGTDSSPKHRNALMQAHHDFIDPPVKARSRLVPCGARGKADHLLVIEIEPSETVHHTNKDEVFLRVGDESRRLHFQQRQELIYDKGQSTFEATKVELTTSEVNARLVENYAHVLSHPDPARLLVARGLAAKDGHLLVAGALLFAEHPQQVLPAAGVRVLRYQGRERGTGSRQQLADDRRFEGPIPHMLDGASEAIDELAPTRRALNAEGKFAQIPLVPKDAWLEGLVNAVVHRSYSIQGDHIRIEIFDDRIEIESPGRFPGLVALRDPRDASRYARNPRIARVCADLRFGQELGEGIRRIYDEMRIAGLADPLYRQTTASVRLTLSGVLVDRELEARLPRETRQIVAAIRAAERLGTGDLEGLLGLSRPATLDRLRRLQVEGVIQWVGNSAKDPRAYWCLAKPR